MQVTIKTLVVALESLGFQCQYVDGSLIATNGGRNMSFVEDSQGEAIGTIPDDLRQALQQITEQQVEKRFSQQMLTELGYGEFSPSAAKPTGVGDTNAKALGIKSGEQAVTGEQPQKGPKKPQDASGLPGDYTGDSENNQPANVPSTGGDSEASKVGPHGAAKTGSPGPNLKGPEKTQGMKVGQSLMQPDAPEADKGDYEGTKVGKIGNVQGDGKGAGGVLSMGKSPAPFPTTQGAQTLAKIPSPGAGKMAVTKATVESVLDDIDRTKPIDEFFYFSDQPEGEWPEYEEGYVEAVDQAAQLPLAVPALEGQLAYRIPLHYPAAEPRHLLCATGCRIAPDERVPAGLAKPPLATVGIAAVSHGHNSALRAVFFGAMTP